MYKCVKKKKLGRYLKYQEKNIQKKHVDASFENTG